MRRLAAVFAVVAVLLGGLVAAPVAESRGNGIERVTQLEAEVLSAVNEVRTARGLQPLSLAPGLRAAAAFHSRAMAENGFFEHDSSDGTSFDRRVRRFYPTTKFAFWSVGENLLYTTRSLDAPAAVKAWLASPGHRRNLLSSQWRDAGVGVVRAASAGGVFGGSETWVLTMDFGTRGDTDRTTQRSSRKSTTKRAA